jgi:hypothetical protein
MGVKRPGRETDHSPPSSAEVKEWVELYLHSPNMPSWRGAQLKHRDNFTFYTSHIESYRWTSWILCHTYPIFHSKFDKLSKSEVMKLDKATEDGECIQ